jgi:hypothetical protein
VAAAAEAARKLPFPFTLTARAENFLRGYPDLEDTIQRLQASASHPEPFANGAAGFRRGLLRRCSIAGRRVGGTWRDGIDCWCVLKPGLGGIGSERKTPMSFGL